MDLIIKYCQKITWIATRIILRIFTDFEIIGQENARDLNGPLLILSNHKSYWDPQLVNNAFPLNANLLPMRYMAKNQLFKYPGLNLLIIFLGAFKANSGFGFEKALEKPLEILKNKGIVIMFPEGKKCSDPNIICDGKKGAAALALLRSVSVLPIAIAGQSKMGLWKLLSFKSRIRIKIGKPFYLNDYLGEFGDNPDNYQKGADIIMEKIKELYFSTK